MKKIIFSALLAVVVVAAIAFAEFFPTVIVTGTAGKWTDTRAYTDLAAAITAIGGNERVLIIVGEEAVGTLTIPVNVRLKFLSNGSLAVATQLTLQTYDIDADSRQIFSGAGDIDFPVGAVVKSSWFANLDEALDVTSDDTLTMIITESETLTANASVGTNVTLKWNSPFIITDGGFTLDGLKKIEAGTYQIFSGAGDFDFLAGSIVHSSWFVDLRRAITFTSDENVDLTIIVDQQETIDFDTTVDVYQTLDIKHGCNVTVEAGDTLTIEGMLNLGGSITGSGALTCSITSNVCATGGTIDLDGAISLPSISSHSPYQIFTGAGAITELSYGIPEWWGAVYDGTTDSTIAIQTAIDVILSVGGVLQFRTGSSHYKITSALEIPGNIYGYHIKGGGGAGSHIVQYTNDEAIIEFTGVSHTFIIEGLYLSWNTQQTSAHTTSYGIGFNHSDGENIYYGVIRDLRIEKGYRGIGISSLVGQLSVWSMTFSNILISDCVGYGIVLDSPTTIGMPNNRFTRISISYKNVVQFEAAMRLVGQHDMYLGSIDIENTTMEILYLGSCTAAIVENVHIEHMDYTTSGGALVLLPQFSGVFRGWSLADGVLGSGFDTANYAAIFRLTNSGTNLGHVSFVNILEDIDIVAGASYMLSTDDDANVSFEGCHGFHMTDYCYNMQTNNAVYSINGTDIRNVAFTDGDTTPSVADSRVFTTNNSAPTTITNFDDGVLGQMTWIITGDSDTTIAHNATIITNTGADLLLTAFRLYGFIFQHAGIWYMVNTL